MTAAQARERFAAARVARLATVDAGGQPHLVPIVFAVDGDTSTAPSTPSPSARPPAAPGQRPGATRGRRCWSTTTTRTGRSCGGCAPTAPRRFSTTTPNPTGRSCCCPTAIPQQRAVASVLAVTSSAGAAGPRVDRRHPRQRHGRSDGAVDRAGAVVPPGRTDVAIFSDHLDRRQRARLPRTRVKANAIVTSRLAPDALVAEGRAPRIGPRGRLLRR